MRVRVRTRVWGSQSEVGSQKHLLLLLPLPLPLSLPLSSSSSSSASEQLFRSRDYI